MKALAKRGEELIRLSNALNESNRNGYVINTQLIESYVAPIQRRRRLPNNEYFITK